MTAEREAMTERQAFEEWARGIHLNVRNGKDGVYSYADTILARAGWQAAIAHLSRAAEPVAWCCPNDPINSTAFSWPGTDRDESRHTMALFTHPPEPARDAKCNWTQDVDGNWGTDCGNLHILIDGTPYDNEMGFCCYCGHAIDQVLYHDAAMSQESGE